MLIVYVNAIVRYVLATSREMHWPVEVRYWWSDGLVVQAKYK